MKILVLFLDMLRANLLKICNENILIEGPIENILKKIGGTVFTNCYTPAPDTPRGLACFYTGLYPKTNGCTTRIQWPKYYLNSKCETIFDMLESKKYQSIVKVIESEYNVGFFPEKNEKKIKVCFDWNIYFNSIQNVINRNVNLFSFIDFSDYHMALDDFGGTPAGDYHGQLHLSKSLDLFFEKLNADIFDVIIIFSDHGCKLNNEIKNKPKIFLLNDDRAKIYMQIRFKNEKETVINSNLQSIMGVFPFLAKELKYKIKNKIDGLDIMTKSMVHVILEDHSSFEPAINNIIKSLGFENQRVFLFKIIDR